MSCSCPCGMRCKQPGFSMPSPNLSGEIYFNSVYTAQVNSTFRARWLASSEVISQVLFTSQQPKENKMAFVATFSQIKLLFGPLVIQLVWYILKQLFTSVSVKVVDICRGAEPLPRWIIVNYSRCQWRLQQFWLILRMLTFPPSLPIAFIYPFLLHPFPPSLGLLLHTHEHAWLRSAVHPLFFPFFPPCRPFLSPYLFILTLYWFACTAVTHSLTQSLAQSHATDFCSV